MDTKMFLPVCCGEHGQPGPYGSVAVKHHAPGLCFRSVDDQAEGADSGWRCSRCCLSGLVLPEPGERCGQRCPPTQESRDGRRLVHTQELRTQASCAQSSESSAEQAPPD